ncbi:sensor histidine kinase [Actinoalloteichus caeruleus]|uniref:histidine kinase n=1 Tax=Actinoalloteichus caeruleus DSM 43889 TaxID=1120930 RepID=A0ABT1JLG3_ACTCY|nr:nitrate- and nitrite sensing domain-containing protein [Actinoalloteichus caeruleus]MCP2332576.1 Signal transduction histidine kinase [Actinoalloteichus caeruleus DSM 43889]
MPGQKASSGIDAAADADEARGAESDGRPSAVGQQGAARDSGVEPAEDNANEVALSPKRSGRWRLQNWKVRNKLIVILLVPTLAAVVLGGFRVLDQLRAADTYALVVRSVELSQRITGLAHELQRERDLAAVYIASGRERNDESLTEVMGQVDSAVASFDSAAGVLATDTASVQSALDRAQYRLGTLGVLRERAVLGSQYPHVAVITTYTSMIDTLLQLNRELAASAADTEVSSTFRGTEAVARAKEQIAIQRSVLLTAAQEGSFVTGQTDVVSRASAQYAAALTEFQNTASVSEANFYADTVTGPEVDLRSRLLQQALARSGGEGGLGIPVAEWNQAAATTLDLMRQVEDGLQGQLHGEAERLAGDVRTAAYRDAGLVLGTLVLALVLMTVVLRSMLSPLRTLRTTALDVAHERLPAVIAQMRDTDNEIPKVSVPAVDVHTREEIGQLARAFDAVHNQAVRLAGEQALLRANVNAMFVNLSRRSQTLVERQLGLIDRLERDEQDPDQLANLFELDHLATRMRRNSENLLVLAGTDTTRRMAKPVPVGDILGAAVSEVEQYARVTVSSTPELLVQGRAVNDLVHLIAELLDNATALSDPSTKVTVRTAHSRKNELIIEITDRGVGMPDEELSAVNERLANPPRVDVGVSRRMGLYVVAQLAKRHEIRVRLRSEYLEGGIIALVVVPAALVVRPSSVRGTAAGALAPPPGPAQPPAAVVSQGGAADPASVPALPPGGDAEDEYEYYDEMEEPASPALNNLDSGVFDASAVQDAGTTATASTSSFFSPAPENQAAEQPAPARRPDRGADFANRLSGARPVGPEDTAHFSPTDVDDAQGRAEEPEGADDDWADAQEALGASQEAPAAPPARPVDRPARQAAQAGKRQAPEEERDPNADLDAPTERLPIYEEVLSQWFQPEDPDAADDQPAEEPAPAPQAQARQPAPRPAAGRDQAAPSGNDHRGPRPLPKRPDRSAPTEIVRRPRPADRPATREPERPRRRPRPHHRSPRALNRSRPVSTAGVRPATRGGRPPRPCSTRARRTRRRRGCPSGCPRPS